MFFLLLPGNEPNDSRQDIHCSKNVSYGGIDLADGHVSPFHPSKTSAENFFKVTTTEAPEQESVYEN